MAKPTKTTEAPKEETQLAKTGTTAMAEMDYGEDAVDAGRGVGLGYENQGNEDIRIPFIGLTQPMTPAVVKQDPPGLMPGMWYDKQSGKIWKNPEGLLFLAVTTSHDYIQYKPRKISGGFQAKFAIDDPQVAKSKARAKELKYDFGRYYVEVPEKNRFEGDRGDELTETFTVLGIAVDEDGEQIMMASIGFKGTMIKTYRNWMTQIRAVTVNNGGKKQIPPIWSHLSRFTTVIETKNNNTFAVPVYAPGRGSVMDSLLPPGHPTLAACKSLSILVNSGKANIDYSTAENEGDPNAGPTDGGQPGDAANPLF